MSDVLSVQVSSRKVDESLRDAPDNFRKGCIKGMRRSGIHVREKIRQLIKNPPKTGFKYPRLPNRSSAPGESPAEQSGTLRKSIKYSVWRYDLMQVGTTLSYGNLLENGTYKMKKRPYVSTAGSQTFNTVLLMLQMSVDEELSR